MPKTRTLIVIIVVVMLAASGLTGYFILRSPSHSTTSVCAPLGNSEIATGSARIVESGATKDYFLPNPSRLPNKPLAAPDGSVWFGEQSVPGVGHLFPNGTIVEYAWPAAVSKTPRGGCPFKTTIWGLALWNGNVWGTDATNNRIVGLDPAKDTFKVVPVPANNSLPYSLSVGPDNALWFTLLASPPRIGRVDSSGQAALYSVTGDSKIVPVDIVFSNTTRGYFVGLNTAGAIGNVYEFNPSSVGSSSSSTINVTLVGGNYNLYQPTSISLDGDTIWVTQHGAAGIASYNIETGTWTEFPTSQVSYISTTLPYFVDANGSLVWFNEHYGNRIAVVNTNAMQLTEVSDSNPPATSISTLDNALTIALGSDGEVWFAATTPNFIGLLDSKSPLPFSISVSPGSNRSLDLQRGGFSETLNFIVSGESSSSLRLNFTDSESSTSTPIGISMVSNVTSIVPFNGERAFSVTFTATLDAAPGNFTALIGVSDGIVTQSAYVQVIVS